MNRKPDKIILFDLDGTLTWGISTTRYLFKRMKKEAFFKKLEKKWLEDRVTHLSLARQVTLWLKGRKISQLHRWLEQMPHMLGISKTVNALKRKGYFVALSTLGYEFSAMAFQRFYGFDAVRGTTVEIRDGVITGKGLKIYQEHEKALYLKALSRRLKIPLNRTIAVGDSRTDREVFKIAGKTIAVNEDGFLTDHAEHFLKGRDLSHLLKLI